MRKFLIWKNIRTAERFRYRMRDKDTLRLTLMR
ncbi:MAG: hypothetical protein RLZZ387_2509 [Chloroflexota bacterium]|jgi:hypothetical protein